MLFTVMKIKYFFGKPVTDDFISFISTISTFFPDPDFHPKRSLEIVRLGLKQIGNRGQKLAKFGRTSVDNLPPKNFPF